MESLRYALLCLAFGIIGDWASENLFWFVPPADLRPQDLVLTVVAYGVASGVGLSLVTWTGLRGLPAAFLGGAVMGYMAEGVIVGTMYDAPLAFYLVWTPLAWHGLISGGLVLGIGRAGRVLGPGRMALVWAALGLALAFWAQYWTAEAAGPMPGRGVLAVYLVGFGVLVVLAQAGIDRIGCLPRPPGLVLWIAPGIAALIWLVQGLADPDPRRLLLPVILALIWWIMARLGRPGGRVDLGAAVPVGHHALVLIAPLVAVLLGPVGWSQDWGTLSANWAVAGVTWLLALVWLAGLAWRAVRGRGMPSLPAPPAPHPGQSPRHTAPGH